jgi:hypothetical protein
MTWWLWTLVIVFGIPVVCVLLAAVTLIGLALIPDRWLPPHCCGCCGKWGYYRRRNSHGYYICDACAGPGEKEASYVQHDHLGFGR